MLGDLERKSESIPCCRGTIHQNERGQGAGKNGETAVVEDKGNKYGEVDEVRAKTGSQKRYRQGKEIL